MNNDGLELIKRTIADLQARRRALPPPAGSSPLNLLGSTPESPAEVAKLQSALQYLTSDAGRGSGSFYGTDGQPEKDNWLAGVWAIASLGWPQGKAIAKNWSEQCSARYTDEGFDKAWNGYKPNHPNPVGIGSLYKRAMELGLQSQSATPAQSDEAYGEAQTDVDLLQQIDQTDAGNVALLYRLTDEELKFVYERKSWIAWSHDRWQFDMGNAMAHQRMLKVAVSHQSKSKTLMRQAQDSAITAEQAQHLRKAAEGSAKWAVQCRNKNRLDAMLGIAQRDIRFLLKASQLDSNPWLLGVANGVVDLRSGTLQPDSKREYVLKRSPVKFDPNSKAPRWVKFIEEITAAPGALVNGKVKGTLRPQVADYLQKALGYSLSGIVEEHVMFIAIGSGANGKNVLLDSYKAVCGEYCETISPEVLMATKLEGNAEQASPSIRKLAGARSAISSESKERQRLDIAIVKRHTGGGYMTARGLHENPMTFEISHKLWLMTNHTPRLDHMDDATKGRLHLIPFDMHWNRPGETNPDPTMPDADKTLMSALKAEYEGILAWLVAGAAKYYGQGLSPPQEVVALTRNFIASQDMISKWLLEECVDCPIDKGLSAGELHESFKVFCDEEAESGQIGTPASLGRRLATLGYHHKKTRTGNFYALRGKEHEPENSDPMDQTLDCGG